MAQNSVESEGQWAERVAGKWTGELRVLSTDGTVSLRVSRIKVEKKDEGWVEQRIVADPSGAVLSQHTFVVASPVIGQAAVSSTDELFQACKANVVVMKNACTLMVTVDETGLPVMVETTTLVDANRRVRSIQTFDRLGNFMGISIVEESRVQ